MASNFIEGYDKDEHPMKIEKRNFSYKVTEEVWGIKGAENENYILNQLFNLKSYQLI